MRMSYASVLLASLSLIFISCGGSSNSGGSGGNGGGVGGGNPPPVTLRSIAVAPASASIAPGTTAQFTAVGTFTDNTTQDLTSQVTWMSSKTTVATINSNGSPGLAKGVATGQATITATMNGVSGSTALIVTSAVLNSITITPANPSINVGTQQQFTATGSFSDGTSQDVTTVCNWTSTVRSVAVVTSNSGVATGKANGTTTITATFSNNVSGSTLLSVTLSNLISLAITPTNPTLAVGTTGAFTAIGTFSDGSTHNLTTQVTWASSATSVATIPLHNSVATAVAPGTTTISATSGSVTGSTVLTVSRATLVSIAVAPTGTTVPAGVKVSFTAVGTFSDSSTQTLTSQVIWSSSNTGVATISNSGGSKGVATALAPGPTSIQATAPAVLGSVQSPPATLTVNTATLTAISVAVVAGGAALTAPAGNVSFNASGKYSDGSTQLITRAVTWSSSNTAVATVNSTGSATGQGVGSANIIATQNSVSGSAQLVVTSSQLKSITIAPPNSSSKLAEQTSVQLTAVGHFADGTTQNLTNAATWTSSAPAIATVSGSSGVLTGIAPGPATITAVFAGVGGNLPLTVTNATLSSVAISPSSATISLGSFQQFTATASFSDGTTEVVSIFANWSSSNPGVALVDSNGLASTAGPGTTTITVTTTQNAISKSDTASLTVN